MSATPPEVTWFDPQPDAAERPERLPSPFEPGPPHPLARRAAEALMGRLREGRLPCDLAGLDQPGRGKMFGVLVVEAEGGRVGYLCAFSGMLDGRWRVEGFAAPLFEPAERDAFWPAGEAELDALEAARRELIEGPEATALRAELAVLDAGHAADLAALWRRHQERKEARRAARARLAPDDAAALHALAQESRADAAEERRLEAAAREARGGPAARLAALDARRSELEARRAERSRGLWLRICDGYRVANARGERRPLAALFAPEAVPGGAGDCAAPKLLAAAYRAGLRPLALAEFWWGAPPLDGGRRAGSFYPACRRKCGGVLPFMLEGLGAAAAPLPGEAAPPGAEPRVLHEDRWLLVLDKPVGLLSVPGRHARLGDSVQSRLRARYPEATGPLLVHRLDLDTSGLLLAAKDAATHAALQRQFTRREVEKRYAAWLDGPVAGERGEIALALRVDLDDRPRQLHDPVHGKPARTTWEVTAREPGRTRVALYPHTGRTHQLRVHAAHPLGLGRPIVGDRLYGRGGERLLLHADALAFTHPHTGERVRVESPAPF